MNSHLINLIQRGKFSTWLPRDTLIGIYSTKTFSIFDWHLLKLCKLIKHSTSVLSDFIGLHVEVYNSIKSFTNALFYLLG